ncbi:hypothetical protein BDV12DRAFT_50707 [Aspergillus spectabilis]
MSLDPEKRNRKNKRSRFKRLHDRLSEYADEFGKLFQSKIYFLLQSKEGKFMVYNNHYEKSWPPRLENIKYQEYYSPETQHFGRTNTKFEKRKFQLIRSANKLACEFSAKVYICIQTKSDYTIMYTNVSSRSWPLSTRQVREVCPSAHFRGPEYYNDAP